MTDEQLEIYDIVLRSNQALIEAAKAGLSRIDFDRIPRHILTMLDMVLTGYRIGQRYRSGYPRDSLLRQVRRGRLRPVWSRRMSRVFI